MMTPEKEQEERATWDAVSQGISDLVLRIAGGVPASAQPAATREPRELADEIIGKAAREAAFISGSLALPPGPLGFLTVLPDLYLIWKRQSQMVADVAAVYDKSSSLTPEAMLYCLFKHAAAQAVRGLAVRAGERTLIQRASMRAMEKTAEEVGVKVTSRLAREGLSRAVPFLGALGVAAYAYVDTCRIGDTAVAFFES